MEHRQDQKVYTYIFKAWFPKARVGTKNTVPRCGFLGQGNSFYGFGRDEGKACVTLWGVQSLRGR